MLTPINEAQWGVVHEVMKRTWQSLNGDSPMPPTFPEEVINALDDNLKIIYFDLLRLYDITGVLESGIKGPTGQTGNGIDGILTKFMVTQSMSKPLIDSNNWEDEIPNLTELNRFLWKKLIFKFTNNYKHEIVVLAAVRGNDGASVKINGDYQNITAFNTANITGQAGDAYIIREPSSAQLVVWQPTSQTWSGLIPFQGPIGPQGHKGHKGHKGNQNCYYPVHII